MPNEIRYFSMFTGVGGFELGLGNISKEKEKSIRKGDEKRLNGVVV